MNVSIYADSPGDLNLPYPSSSNLQDTQEFEVKRTLSGTTEIPKNRFGENKKWVLTWDNLTREQYTAMEALINVPSFSMKDPLGRSCWLKIYEFRPSHVRGVQDLDGRPMYALTIEALVLGSNHNLYAPGGVSIVSAGSGGNQTVLSATLHKKSFTAQDARAFGPVIESELNRPPVDWNRSARDGVSSGSGAGAVFFASESMDGYSGSVFFAFETGA